MYATLRSISARIYRKTERVLRQQLHLYQSEDQLIAASQHYWSRTAEKELVAGNAHWRHHGIFRDDDARWLNIGRHNRALFDQLAGTAFLQQPRRIVDWGSGGGVNALFFAPDSSRYYGLDINEPSLQECGRQLQAAGVPGFVPVLFDAATPETVVAHIPEPCDLVFSTYVFELFPSADYGRRVLAVMAGLLRPGGLAFIQIKYTDHRPTTRSYRWGYAQNLPHMTTYRIEEFWQAAAACNLQPQLVYLDPKQQVELGERYAYYLLRKSETA